MATTKKNVIKYINDTTAQVTKAFEKKACVFGTEEFKLWREYKEVFPKAQMTTKSIKKNPDQKTRRNMTYENMEAYIMTFDEENVKKYMDEFHTIKKRSKIQKSPYQFVLSWFEATFEGFSNCVNVILFGMVTATVWKWWSRRQASAEFSQCRW